MISDFERMRQVGLLRVLEEITYGTFAILCAGNTEHNLADIGVSDKRQTELKTSILESDYSFISTRYSWITAEDEATWGHALLVPGMTSERALLLGKDMQIEIVLIGVAGQVRLVSRSIARAISDKEPLTDLLNLAGSRSQVRPIGSFLGRSTTAASKYFFCYQGRPPTGVAKYGFVRKSEGQPLPLTHLGTVLHLPKWV